jgi:hypothetical protein
MAALNDSAIALSKQIPVRPDRRDDPIRQREVPELAAGVLAAPVGMDNCLAFRRTPPPDRHRQRVGDQFGPHVPGDCPADDLPRIPVDDRGQIRPPRPRVYIGDVGEPQLVGAAGHEAALDEGRPSRRRPRRRGPWQPCMAWDAR